PRRRHEGRAVGGGQALRRVRGRHPGAAARLPGGRGPQAGVAVGPPWTSGGGRAPPPPPPPGGGPGYRSLCPNHPLLFGRPWLDGPTALAALLEESGDLRLATTASLPVLR